MITRIPIRVLSNSFRKAKGHSHAAVRAAYPGSARRAARPPFQVCAAMFGIQHRHTWSSGGPCPFETAKTRRRLALLDAGRHRRAQDPAVGVVEDHLLLLIDTIAMIGSPACAGAVASVGARARLSPAAPAVSAVSRPSRERHNGGSTPTPHAPWIAPL